MLCFGVCAGYTGLDVRCQQGDTHGIQCRPHSGDLRENIDTVPIFVDHLLNTVNLSRNAPEPVLYFHFGVSVHALPSQLVYPEGDFVPGSINYNLLSCYR